MPRRIANALTLVSAVVCVLSAMGVGRSFFCGYQVWTQGQIQASVAVIDGLLINSTYVSDVGVTSWGGSMAIDAAALRPKTSAMLRRISLVPWLGLGFNFAGGSGAVGSPSITEVILPLWLLPLLTAIAPVRGWRKRRREARRGFPVAAT